MDTLNHVILPFIREVAEGRVEVYNAFSLQHELGLYLRSRFNGCKVQFERNVTFFFQREASFSKREIDISVFRNEREPEWAIELKYPRNGQYPEQMFTFCKDIAFTEELRNVGFRHAALVVFADHKLFYDGDDTGIYGFFRGARTLNGRIQKPTGKRDAEVSLRGQYEVRWKKVLDSLRYFVIEASDGGASS